MTEKNKKSSITKQKSGFTTIPNKLINDNRVSLTSKSFYIYLLSKKDEKKKTYENIRQDLNIKTNVINNCFGELIRLGWITQDYELPHNRTLNTEVSK